MNKKEINRDEQRYNGTIVTLNDVKKKAIIQRLRSDNSFQEFISSWVKAMMNSERDQHSTRHVLIEK